MNITQFWHDHLLWLDGGMGTLLQNRGLPPGGLPERWNLSHPEVITEIHRSYFDAGSHVVCTNTFGANGLKFSPQELSDIIHAAVGHARSALASSSGSQPKWVALDIGPTGKMLAPYGDFDFEEAVATFAQVVRLGAEAGADLILIETMGDSYETKAALLAARETCDLPVLVSNAYGEDGKLMTGADPAAMVAMLEGMGADAIGVNCSLGPQALEGVVEEYLRRASVPVLVKPNAGLPRAVNGETVFDLLPADFAHQMARLIQKGVRIAGGCCGTTPDYISALLDAAGDLPPVPVIPKNIACISSYTHAVDFGIHPLLIGERINPTGKKRFKEALKSHDMDYILQEGIAQQEKGVHILDVNVGLPELDEVAMLQEAVCQLQAILDLPIQIDSSDELAMAAALRRYNGKALINSVNGKQESMDAIFPLVKKYGGMVVALTLDEGGIPERAEGRVAIARKILEEAARYGLGKQDLIFDPLALTVSADQQAARETLKAVSLIHRELGCHTSLGVSNVSFGLPRRELINSHFLTLAMGEGLSAAILNPDSRDMMTAYHTFCALWGLDPQCARYISYAQQLPVGGNTPAVPTLPAAGPREEGQSDLQRAIIKGLKEQAGLMTAELLQTRQPLDIVREEIIPALDIVGIGFEQKTVYLPQLLMSAEGAKAAFEQIKGAMTTRSAADKCAFVIATVQGDIHDIGKNIVKLLLENYGFAVTDLGRDVPPERVVDTVVAQHAPMAGLSALMTTTVPAMAETIARLREKAPWCKVVVGGAVLNQEYADAIGADKYARDAMETVRYAEQIDRQLKEE